MVQTRTTKLSKLLLVFSTVLIMVPFIINSHRHPEGPPPPQFRHGPFPMAMAEPMREGMRHRERAGAAMPEGVSDRKVMPMPAQIDDAAPVFLSRADVPHPPPHGRRHCIKGVLAAIVGVAGLVAGATESRRAVTVFIVVLVLAFTASTSMSIFRAHNKVASCRAEQSIAALGRDFRPEMPQQMPMRPAFERPMPNQLGAQASSGMAAVNANVNVNAMDRADGVNQIQPISVVEVEEIDIEIEVRDDSPSASTNELGTAAAGSSNRRSATALHKRGPWGHGRRHNELPLNAHHGHHGHHGSNDCERAVKGRTAHKIGCSVVIAAVFLLIARMLRKSIVADEQAAGATPIATTKCGGEIYEGVPVKCSSDDVVVVV